MSDGADETPKDDDAGPDSGAMRALLRRAMPPAEPEPAASAPKSALLGGVHTKLRKRSRGKFFADGWSTTQSRINYGLVSVVMLVLLVATYVALGPMGISAP